MDSNSPTLISARRDLHPTQRQILHAIADAGALGRIELAMRVGLSQASVSVLSRDLIARGLLCESGGMEPRLRPGRPSARLTLNPRAGFFIGAFIEARPSLITLADLVGNVAAEAVLPPCPTPGHIAPAIEDAIPGLLRRASIKRSQIEGIGLALTGLVDREHGLCLQSSLLGWRDAPVAALVADETGIPTCLENDANVVAVGERLFGCARQARDFSIVVLGAGIGCAHVMNGALYRGHGGGAGELAHCTIAFDGPMCRCGRRGCLDTFASREAIMQAAAVAGIDADTPRDIERRAADGDMAALGILRGAGRALGLAIAQLVQINCPQFVLVTDVDDICGALLTKVVRETMQAHVLPHLAASVELRFARGDKNIWARGAASIAALRFLDGPGQD